MNRPVVLVHGTFHGAWCWERVVTRLAALGTPAAPVHLPIGGVHTAAGAVRRVLDELPGAVVVGHSSGGTVITQATADRTDVHRLVYVAARLQDVGQARADTVLPGNPANSWSRPGWHCDDQGLLRVDRSEAVRAFYGECPPEDVPFYLDQLRPTHRALQLEPITGAGWQHIPSTYLVCARDQAVDPDEERAMAARCADVRELDSDHSPMLSMPGALAEILHELATKEPW